MLVAIESLEFVDPSDAQRSVSVTVLGGSPFALCYIMRTVAAGPGASPFTGVVQPGVYAPPPEPVGAAEASGMGVRSVRGGVAITRERSFPDGRMSTGALMLHAPELMVQVVGRGVSLDDVVRVLDGVRTAE